ncbi:MAG: hypothetical protein WCT27_02050 [Patescibacteria group bacterium]|jgi:hypothetical protein
MPLDQLQNPTPSSSASLPSENRTPAASPKKRHFFRNLFITLLVIIVIVAIGVSATGVYAVPGISGIFGMNKPKDLGVTYSAADLTTLGQKIPLTISKDRVSYGGDPATIFTGTVPVDTQNTSAEITAFLNRFSVAGGPISDTQVRMIEGGVEVSGMLNMYVKAPAYAKVMITRTSEKSVAIDIQSAKIGAISVPANYLKQANDWANKKVNERMASTPGFSMTQLEYHDGYDIFKGSVPKDVKSAAGGWTDLILK